jgi:hypothetical protein
MEAVMVGGMGCVWCVFVGGAATVGLAGTVLWIWALVDCLTKEGDEHNNRLIWTLVIVDALFEIGCRFAVPRTTSGLVEQQRLFRKLPR